MQTWLHDWDLLVDTNSKKLLLEQVLCRFQALSKYQFGEAVGEATQHTFLCYLVPFKDKPSVVQMDMGQVWDPKNHYFLDLTNTLPIWAESPCFQPKK